LRSLAGTIKDTVTRYAHQTGHHVERRFGWDTHGLPVEFEIDKALGISGAGDVLKMGIDKYNAECRSIVMRYSSVGGGDHRDLFFFVLFWGDFGAVFRYTSIFVLLLCVLWYCLCLFCFCLFLCKTPQCLIR
jgi:isoleucyl-tRNA synthetase